MHTSYGQLTYCTNIHAGESWKEHFAQLQQHIPAVKAQVGAGAAFGIGLRLSNLASLELSKETALRKELMLHDLSYRTGSCIRTKRKLRWLELAPY